MLPCIAIVGRPNVGKSTLFNRLVQSRQAIVHNQPGVTRDRNDRIIDFYGSKAKLIDTGGIDFSSNQICSKVRQQIQDALKESDAIIFLADVRDGFLDEDKEIFHLVKCFEKPFYFAVNKVDSDKMNEFTYDFYRSGISEIFPISAEHNIGIAPLLEKVFASLNDTQDSEQPSITLKLALLGKPNAGKSSLINRLLGQERMIVDELPGTTRDSIESILTRNGQNYSLIDTAGIRRKNKIHEKIEQFCVSSSIRSAEQANLVFLVIDSEEGVCHQIAKLADLLHKKSKPIVILCNKIDLLKTSQHQFKKKIYNSLTFLDHVPIICVSAKTGKGLHEVLKQAELIWQQYSKRISTYHVNLALKEILMRHAPPVKFGKSTSIYYACQIASAPPKFAFISNQPQAIGTSYERYMINRLRYYFGFEGVPIQVVWRKRKGQHQKK